MYEQSANHMNAICELDMYCAENDVVWTVDLDETYCANYSDESRKIHYGTRTFPVFYLCAKLYLCSLLLLMYSD